MSTAISIEPSISMPHTVKMSTSDANQDLIEDRSRFRSNDMELLRTGQFSDAQVVGGGRTWKVHKSIVCSRSGVLAQALSDQSEAAETATVRIWHQTERLVGFLFEFIYSGRKQAAWYLYSSLGHAEYNL